ncbi:MAG: hypothetical protein Q9185_006843 [Variospora sp. 1 TL-2023]
MDYLIDDMLNTPRRRSTRNNPTSPAPPLPSFPTPTRVKKSKNATFAINTKATSSAATVPLPTTPTPPSTPSQPAQPLPKSIPASATSSQSDCCTAVKPEPTSSANALGSLPVPGEFPPQTPTFITPTSEFPMTNPKLPSPAEEPPSAADEIGEHSTAAETHALVAKPEKQLDAMKNSPGDQAESLPPVLQVAHTTISRIQSGSSIMIGLSGAPASGKTTLTHLLSAILPPSTPSFIIYQDDFFVRKHLLIPGADGELEVDYRRTVDFSAFKKLIKYSKREGQLPPGYRSLQPEQSRERALSQISSGVIENMRASLASVLSLRDGQPVGIVDGFMLFHSATIRDLLDVKILLRASKEVSKLRYEEHTKAIGGSAGKGGDLWETLGYFDRVLWQIYVGEYAVLFEDRIVEGRPVPSVCEDIGISVQPKVDMGVEEVLQWVADILRRTCEEAAVYSECASPLAAKWKGEHEHCDCNDGLLGKLRQIIFDLI